MQIQIKQLEIEQAIKSYLARQGIRIQGRDVEISFTAGRKNSGGITADISISEDLDDLPDFSDSAPDTFVEEVKTSPLKLVDTTDTAPVQTEEAKDALPEDTPDSVQSDSATESSAGQEADEPAPKKTLNSLFS